MFDYGVPQSEVDALLAFYDATASSWVYITNWKTETLVSIWHGITVSSGHVTEISLNNNLVGSAGNTLDPLASNLTRLSCYNNNILTLDVSDLINLAYLSCGDNGIDCSNVDTILCSADATLITDGYLNISGTNAAPSATGLDCKSSLEGNVWNVTITT